MTTISGWAHVTLSVQDHDRSVGWYGEILGFKPVDTETTPQWKRTLCLHADSGVMLVLHQHFSGEGGAFDPGRTGLDHVAFHVPDREALVAWQDRLAAQGVSYTPVASAGRGGLVVAFRDPDGIALEFFFRP
ncbi:VOC family protein [Actinoplanes sp. NPDC051513]|uniref:VOC family protein n=1 Tax=Actinoplanes sp. NPDC051513 TaxID=3363908 RepID=UPI0037899966